MDIRTIRFWNQLLGNWQPTSVEASLNQKIVPLPYIGGADGFTLRAYLTWHLPDGTNFEEYSVPMYAGPGDVVPLESQGITAQWPGNYTVDIAIVNEATGQEMLRQNNILVARVLVPQPAPVWRPPAQRGLPWLPLGIGAAFFGIVALISRRR